MRNGSAASISSRFAVSSSTRAIVMLSIIGSRLEAGSTRHLASEQYAASQPLAESRRPQVTTPCPRWRGQGKHYWRLVNLAGDFFETQDLVGLWSLRSLNNVELDFIAFLQALIAFALNRGVVNKHV